VDPASFLDDIESARTNFEKKLAGWEASLDISPEKDDVWTRLRSVLADRTGQAPDQETIDGLQKIGDKRFSSGIPPGHRDQSKKSVDSGGYNASGLLVEPRFGDLAIWFEILELIKERNLPSVVFVTEDAKDDWWVIAKGKRVAPQPSLLAEAMAKSPGFQMLVLSSTTRFLERIGKQYKKKVGTASLKEVEDVAQRQRTVDRDWIASQRATVERALGNWIVAGGRFSSMEWFQGFPDIIAIEANTALRIGIDLKYLHKPVAGHLHPILESTRNRGQFAIDGGLIDRIELVLAAPDRTSVVEIRKGITRYADNNPIGFRIIICIAFSSSDGTYDFEAIG